MVSNVIRAVLLGVVVLVLGGCVGAQIMKDKPQPQPSADNAMVYFFRESHFAGGGVVYDVQDNGKTIGMLQSGTYFYYPAAPGDHTFSAKTESSSTVTLHVEAGKTYYVRGSVTMGAFVGHPKLEVADAAAWQTQFADLKYGLKPDGAKNN